ncbi:hypothetical protein TYRP_001838 [Tyrophagus putrescentiae]|nr:hypothetical protein TYRP_001838 [Tyrophagus putrescentiae]
MQHASVNKTVAKKTPQLSSVAGIVGKDTQGHGLHQWQISEIFVIDENSQFCKNDQEVKDAPLPSLSNLPGSAQDIVRLSEQRHVDHLTAVDEGALARRLGRLEGGHQSDGPLDALIGGGEGRLDDARLTGVDGLLSGEAHRRALTRLSLQSLQVAVVDVHGVDGLQLERPLPPGPPADGRAAPPGSCPNEWRLWGGTERQKQGYQLR